MAGAKNHQYHILPPSIWPLFGAMAALVLAAGGIMWMHSMPSANLVFFAGVAGVLITFFGWWSDVIKEAHAGDHTPIVQLHLRYGMILFIASEVMFFVGWFWAWFDFSLFPSTVEAVGGTWPPKGMEVFDAFKLPLLNTLILLCSGCTVTWAHHGLLHNERGGAMKGLWGLLGVGENDSVKKGLWLTVILGISFTALQALEYSEAPFPFKAASDHGSSYGGAFFMATGFHGFHVLVGTIFLIVNLVRVYKGHFTPRQHFGFEAAAWYWHFVDVVWLFLFASIYVWGGWGAPVHAG
ncbi:cytochrome c oxidase subunit 3 [Sphingomonas psychrotolerans]|uniref:cytochrome-c oxidase n=1 Tax=Sphingomonas psychrotolerans TaxID=1327635 RepID=A0ABU3N7P4_9SPHN|nr:cytochrome c oxidase subunit 3 [Sphingomonas psychrotolerans]MDT8760418.1 cytochrome c oxidase subunit 3 [Sphingomonas psychrotolerans]